MAQTPATMPASMPAEELGDAPRNDIPIELKWSLVDDRGVPYREFRRELEPRWGRVWLEIGLAYGAIGAVLVALVAWSPVLPGAIAAGLAGALLIGYAVQFLGNFFHEAAHYNLAPARSRNDAVTNLLMGWLFGSSIATYRRTHFQHHRALGTTMDSEISYFDALRMRYLAEGLIGIRLLKTLGRWRSTNRQLAERSKAQPRLRDASRLAWIGVAAAANAGLVLLLALLGGPAPAIAWVVAMLVVFPFLASLRQLLEHRSEDADRSVDYRRQEHGPVNRLFGDGIVASTLGSAGFNRHAIHHWEPTVSYTRLRDIEAYLLRTPAAGLIRERQTTYADTFLRLLEL